MEHIALAITMATKTKVEMIVFCESKCLAVTMATKSYGW